MVGDRADCPASVRIRHRLAYHTPQGRARWCRNARRLGWSCRWTCVRSLHFSPPVPSSEEVGYRVSCCVLCRSAPICPDFCPVSLPLRLRRSDLRTLLADSTVLYAVPLVGWVRVCRPDSLAQSRALTLRLGEGP